MCLNKRSKDTQMRKNTHTHKTETETVNLYSSILLPAIAQAAHNVENQSLTLYLWIFF